MTERGINSMALNVLTQIVRHVGDERDWPMVQFPDDFTCRLTWDEPAYFLEVEVMDCGDEFCGCFRWFYVKDNFQQGSSGLECADDMSDAFKKVLERSVKGK